jgi:hypothetical protein
VTVRSTRSAAAQGPDAATVQLLDNGRISHLRIENTGTSSTYSFGIYSATPAGRNAVIEDVEVVVNGTGGVGHYAIYLNDAEPTIRHSAFTASGANAAVSVNAGLGSVNIAGGFPQALIENSSFRGTGSNSGFGFQMTNSAPTVRFSTIHGDFRGISALVNGQTRIESSALSEGGFTDAFLFESTSSAAILVAGSQVSYLAAPSHKHTGTGGLVCIDNYKANFTAATDGTTSGTACN